MSLRGAFRIAPHRLWRDYQIKPPHTTPQFRGFSPPLSPRLIAQYHTHGPALAISKGLDRDRAVDESGNQLAVFGRIGSRPLTTEETKRMYMRDGKVFIVTDEPTTELRAFNLATGQDDSVKGAEKRDRKRPGRR